MSLPVSRARAIAPARSPACSPARSRARSLRAAVLGVAALAACVPQRRPTSVDPAWDLLVTNARVVDGTGSPWYRGMVAVRGDRIAYVGPVLPGARAGRVIDAGGMVVAPGFVDMLGHSESSILRNPLAESKITQGITSEITGEVSSAWPNTTPGDDPRAAPWRSLDGYYGVLDSIGHTINLGTYVGAASVRRAVMGDASRRPSEEEMRAMEGLVDSAMRDGAVGFSTGLIYPPSTFFSTDELVRLTRRAAAYGGGYASHIRNEGDSLLPAIREAIRVGAEAGTWVQIRHLKSSGERNWGRMRDAVALIDSARRAGLDVTADMYPYVASGTGLDAILPIWVQAGGDDSMLVRLADPAVRARLRADAEGGHWRPRDPAQVLVNSVRAESLEVYEGKRLDEVGRMRGQEPYEAAYDILLADSGRTSAIYFTMAEEDLRTAMRQPWVSFGQDAGATTPDTTGRGRGHPRGFGTFPRVLGRYVREDSVLTLEDAVRKMTALPAQRVGLAARGVLKQGMHADLVVFDPATVIDRATFERPQQLSEGIRFVAINGVLVLDGGRVTGARPGRALRGAWWRASRSADAP